MLLKLNAGLSDLEDIRNFISRAVNVFKVDNDLISDLILAVDEAVTNIINYGYHGKQGGIEIELMPKGNDLVIILRDRAQVFDPASYQKSIPKSPFDEKNPGGYGLHLIRNIMDEISHKISSEGGNELYLIKHNAIIN